MSKTMTKKMKSGAVYFGDNGRAMCTECAGMTPAYTLTDLSGQRLHRFDVVAAREFDDAGFPPGCECGHTMLSTVAGPDGWPMVKA